MSGHSRKEHLATIRGALTTAAKAFGCLIHDVARPPRPRAATTAVNTKTADIAATVERAGDERDAVDAFMAFWYAEGAARDRAGSVYGVQSPGLVAEYILRQSGLMVRGFNASDLAGLRVMAAAYDWLPPATPARIGDIAVYGGPGYGTVGVVADLTPRHRFPMVFTQGPFLPRVVNLNHMRLLGYHRLRANV